MKLLCLRHERHGETQMCQWWPLASGNLQPSVGPESWSWSLAWAADVLPEACSQDGTVFLRARCVSEEVLPSQRCHTCRLIGTAERFLSSRGCRLLCRQPEKCSVSEFLHSSPSFPKRCLCSLSFLPLPFTLFCFYSFFLPSTGASPRPPNRYLPNLWPETAWHFPRMAGIYRLPKKHLWHLLTWVA